MFHRADASVGTDYVFISQNDTAFQDAINDSGDAEFVCAVYGSSERGAQYSLIAMEDVNHVSLIKPEQAALAAIYQRCEPGSVMPACSPTGCQL